MTILLKRMKKMNTQVQLANTKMNPKTNLIKTKLNLGTLIRNLFNKLKIRIKVKFPIKI